MGVALLQCPQCQRRRSYHLRNGPWNDQYNSSSNRMEPHTSNDPRTWLDRLQKFTSRQDRYGNDMARLHWDLEGLNEVEFRYYDLVVRQYPRTNPVHPAPEDGFPVLYQSIFTALQEAYEMVFRAITGFINSERANHLIARCRDMQAMVYDTSGFLQQIRVNPVDSNLPSAFLAIVSRIDRHAARSDFLTLHIFRQLTWYYQVVVRAWSPNDTTSYGIETFQFQVARPLDTATAEGALLTMSYDNILQEVTRSGINEIRDYGIRDRSVHQTVQNRRKLAAGALGAGTVGAAAYLLRNQIADAAAQQWASAADTVSGWAAAPPPVDVPTKGVLDTALDGLYNAVSMVSGQPYISGAIGLGLVGLTGLGGYLYSRRKSASESKTKAAVAPPVITPSTNKPISPSAAAPSSLPPAAEVAFRQDGKRTLPNPSWKSVTTRRSRLSLMSLAQRMQRQRAIASQLQWTPRHNASVRGRTNASMSKNARAVQGSATTRRRSPLNRTANRSLARLI